MNHRRFFIVYFTGLNEEKQQQRGKIHMFVENDGYINEEFVHASIEQDYGLTDPYITNVQELDEADFNDFTAPYLPDKQKTPENNIDKPQQNNNLNDFI